MVSTPTPATATNDDDDEMTTSTTTDETTNNNSVMHHSTSIASGMDIDKTPSLVRSPSSCRPAKNVAPPFVFCNQAGPVNAASAARDAPIFFATD